MSTEPSTPSKLKSTAENGVFGAPSESSSGKSSRTSSRTRPPDLSTPAHRSSGGMSAIVAEGQKIEKEEILIPSTIPHEPTGEIKNENNSQPLNIDSKRDEENAGVPSRNLDPCDWDKFEVHWESELRKARDKEDEIAQECDALFQAFHIWASAASMKDTERSMKRLKTRERYIQLEERALEEKVEHYDQVVKAFEQAMSLFKLPSRAK